MSSESTGSAPGAGGGSLLPSLCGWETAWLARALERRLAGARVRRVEGVGEELLVLDLDFPGAPCRLGLWSAPRGAALFLAGPAPTGRRSRAGGLPEWSAALLDSRLVGVASRFPLRLLLLHFERADRSCRLVVDPVRAGGNLYLLGEGDRLERRWRNRGAPPGEALWLPAASPFPPAGGGPASPEPPGSDARFQARLVDGPAWEELAEPPDAALMQRLYAYSGDFLSWWNELCGAAWQARREELGRARRLEPLRKERARLLRALERLAEDRRALGDPEALRREADLLAAQLHRVRRGMDAVDLDDLYSGAGATRVVLDPARTPQENLAARYAAYRKARRGLLEIERLDAERSGRLRELELEMQRLAEAPVGPEDEAKERSASAAPRPKSKPLPKGVQRFRTPDGCELYLGRSADGNDRLVRQILRGRDYWFHVADGTGSHVVLRSSDRSKEPPEAALLEAARLAHFNSSLREEPGTVVVCVPGKWVRKVKGAPGRVTYSHPRTLRVDPDPGLFERLERS